MVSDTLMEVLKIAVPNSITLSSLVLLYLNNRHSRELDIRKIGVEYFSKDCVAAYAEIIENLLEFKDDIRSLKTYIFTALKILREGSTNVGTEELYRHVVNQFDQNKAEAPGQFVLSRWNSLTKSDRSLRKKVNAKRLYLSAYTYGQISCFTDDVDCHQVWASSETFLRFSNEAERYERTVEEVIEAMKLEVRSQVFAAAAGKI